MKKLKKAAALGLSAVFVVSAMPIHALAYTNSEGVEGELKDGKYQGTTEGFRGNVTVEVTVSDGKITAIDALEQDETPRFWSKAVAVIDSIIENQSTEVDAVSGATYSSNAIKNATKNALEGAFQVKEEPSEEPSDEPSPEEPSPEAPSENPEDEDEVTSLTGEGTKENPYKISKEAELVFFRDSVNAGTSYQGQYVEVTGDLSLSEDWIPVGTGKDNPFSGSFDGNNYTITNLKVTSDSVATDGSSFYAGLFGYITTYADVEDVRLTNVDINVTDKSGLVYAGALVGSMYNTVTNGSESSVVNHCYADGSVNVGTNGKSTMTGGLVGMANQYAAVANNTVNVNVSATTGDFMGYVGGIVGMASTNGLIANNAALGNVTVNSAHANATAGGIVAQASTCLLYNNYSIGSIAATKNGGVVGNVLANTWVLDNYYTAENSTGANSGNVDEDTVLRKDASEMKDTEFAALLHENLSEDGRKAAAEKVDTNDKVNFESFTSRVESFYDWAVSNGNVVVSNSVWSDSSDVPVNPEKPEKEAIFESGNGTKEDPYTISTEKQLRDFAKSFSDDNKYEGEYVALSNDIALEDGDWTPIGEGEYAFKGDFDGKGHKVTGIKNGTADNHYKDNGSIYYGFFGVLEKEAYVHDLTVDVNLYVESDDTIIMGGIVAYTEGTIDSCTVNGNVWGRSGITEDVSNHFSGGFAGYSLRAAFVNCVNNADVYGQASGGIAEAGGIVGLNNRSLIANCVGNGDISGSADREEEGMTSLGGIAGVHAGTMVSCVGNADINSHDYSMYVGELAGWATGIGYLYDNYYNSQAKVLIDGKQVEPVESVGWLVGPGTSDEGWKFEGGINYNAKAISANEVNSTKLAEELNALYEQYPADVATFSSTASLKKWTAGNEIVLPNGEVSSYTYKEVVIEEEEPEEELASGKFYGRSNDGSTIVAVYYDDDKNLVTEAVIGNTDENSDEYKQAVETAKSKMELNDHTEYGNVDPSIFESGDGTKESPYMISTENQLRAFNKSLNSDEDYLGKYVALKNDITLSQEWTLAGGSNPYAFSGEFDGKGHTISGIVIGSESAPSNYRYAGLFPYLKGAVVKNLKLTGARIYTKTDDDRRFYAGVLSAFADSSGMDGYVDSVYVSDSVVNVQTYSGAAYGAGLIASDQFNVITNCKVDADVTTVSKAAWNYTGILTGINARSAIINNRVSGKLSVSANLNKAAAGGIGGFVAGLTYNNAADVDITSEKYTNDIGQIAGRNTGISYVVKDYYNKDASTVCGGNTVETKAVGTIVDGSSEGNGEVGEMVAFADDEFNANTLLAKLDAGENTESYKSALSFLKENWGIDYEAVVNMKPWTNKSVDNAPANEPGRQASESSNSGQSIPVAQNNQPEVPAQGNRVRNANRIAANVAEADDNPVETIDEYEEESEDVEEPAKIESSDSTTAIDEEAVPAAGDTTTVSNNNSAPFVVVIIIAIALAAGGGFVYIKRR